MMMQLASVVTKIYPDGHRKISTDNHITIDGTKSICGRIVAVVQLGTPSIHNTGCTICSGALDNEPGQPQRKPRRRS